MAGIFGYQYQLGRERMLDAAWKATPNARNWVQTGKRRRLTIEMRVMVRITATEMTEASFRLVVPLSRYLEPG